MGPRQAQCQRQSLEGRHGGSPQGMYAEGGNNSSSAAVPVGCTIPWGGNAYRNSGGRHSSGAGFHIPSFSAFLKELRIEEVASWTILPHGRRLPRTRCVGGCKCCEQNEGRIFRGRTPARPVRTPKIAPPRRNKPRRSVNVPHWPM